MRDFQPARLGRSVILVTVALGACMPDRIGESNRLPELPPPDAFRADFSYFQGRTPEPGGSTLIWEKALSRIEAADTVARRVLSVPLAALTAAELTVPMRSGSLWRWPIFFSVGGDDFDGELRSGRNGSYDGWDLILSAPLNNPPLTNYLWATGLTTSDGFQGSWNIASADGEGQIASGVVYAVGPQGLASFQFAVTDSSSWRYERDPESTALTYLVHEQPRTRVWWFHDSGTGATWSSVTGTDECWDEDLHDVAC